VNGIIKQTPGSVFPLTDRYGRAEVFAYLTSSVPRGEVGKLEFRVNVLESAEPGMYRGDLVLSYRNCEEEELPITYASLPVSYTISEVPAPIFIRATWEKDGLETSVGPGYGVADLKLTFQAPKDVSMSNILARLVMDPPFANSTGGRTVEATVLGTVGSGEAFTLSFPIRLSNDVRLGTYGFSVDLEYTNHWLTRKHAGIMVTVGVGGSESLRLEYTPVDATLGSEASLPVRILNKGTAPIYKVTVRVAVSGQGITVLTDRFDLPSLGAGEATLLDVRFYASSSAAEGRYQVSLSIDYQDVLGISRREDFSAAVNLVEPTFPGFSAQVSGIPLKASNFSRISIIFRNDHPTEVREVKVSLSLGSTYLTVLSGSLTIYVPVLKPHEQIVADYVLAVAPGAGDTVSEGVATITYRDATGILRTTNIGIPFVILGDIDLMLNALKFSPVVVGPGDIVDVAGDIINTGTTVGRAVAVEIRGEPPLQATLDSSSFIGTVEPSQVSAFSLTFRVSEDALPGRYQAVVVATYKNGFGQRFEVAKPIEYAVTSKPVAQSPTTTPSSSSQLLGGPFTLLIVAAAVVVILVALVARRRRSGK